jgi:hypothetical protein
VHSPQRGSTRRAGRGDALRRIEQDLLERPGQFLAPHQGRRHHQRMLLDAHAKHVKAFGWSMFS